jgi:FkbM family methyltransferase
VTTLNILRSLLSSLRGSKTPQAPPTARTDIPVPTLSLEQYEAYTPIVVLREGTVEVTYCTPNRLTKMRVDTLFSKEPDTIEWIRGFEPGDVLLDVGANIGMYAIWAAKTRGVRVFAFEPESQNFALLYRNIILNGLGNLVTGYCAALAEREDISVLYLSRFQAGGSCHTFGEAVDYNLREYSFGHAQGCFSTTLDHLVARGVLPVPNHVKIDVDGLEHRVLEGCRNTLEDRRVRSVLVEINTGLPEHVRIPEQMKALGFHWSDSQVAAAMRREGPFKGVGNHVFRR